MDRLWKRVAALWLICGMCFGLMAGEQFSVEVIPPPVVESPSPCIVIAYTTQFCGPCNRWKATEKDKLIAAGIRVEYLDADRLSPEWSAWIDKARRDYGMPITTVPHFFVIDGKTRTLISPPLNGFKSALHLISVGTRRNFMAPPKRQAITGLSCEEIRSLIRARYSPRTPLQADVSPRSMVWNHLTDGSGGTHTYRDDQVSCLSMWEAMALHDDAHKANPQILQR